MAGGSEYRGPSRVCMEILAIFVLFTVPPYLTVFYQGVVASYQNAIFHVVVGLDVDNLIVVPVSGQAHPGAVLHFQVSRYDIIAVHTEKNPPITRYRILAVNHCPFSGITANRDGGAFGA